MPKEPDAPAEEPQEPATEPETPEEPEEPEPQDTPDADGSIDWEARYKEAERTIGRQGQELSLWRRGETPKEPEPDDDDAPAAPTEDPNPYVQRLEEQSWDLAQRLYGAEAIDAYTSAARLIRKATTPADYIAAFEAYHERRSGGAKPADAAAQPESKPTRAQALAPKVDPNRSDASPDPSIDEKLEEARSKGDLKGFVSAATRRMGFGG